MLQATPCWQVKQTSYFRKVDIMNLLLFNSSELREDATFLVRDRRADHLIDVLEVVPEQEIKAGVTNGPIGKATVLSVTNREIELSWTALSDPPENPDCILAIALPRPKMIRRILQAVASLGIKEIHLINSWRVNKSYWQSPMLTEAALREQLVLGLEQSVDTILPKIYSHRLFKPFAEDILPSLARNRLGLVAHPYQADKCPVDIKGSSLVAIGPEGGFIDYEIELLIGAGLKPVNLGPRILKVETAVPSIISRLYAF